MSSNDSERVARVICQARGLGYVNGVGSGAFKHSFHVRAPDGSPRALKVYFQGSPARIEREVQAINRCTHPGVVKFELLDIWRDQSGEYLYSLEEFLDGGTLSDRLATGLLDASEIRSLGHSLVDAVGHIAALGLVHRDLKPDNIMFRGSGAPVIVDFGLVRDLGASSLTKTWAMRGPGTPFFASPEQLKNEKALIDWRSDQFALGLVLGICLTGSHPYAQDGDAPEDVVERVARRDVPSGRFVEATRDAGLGILQRMIAPWPVHRYRIASELARDWPT